MCISRSYRSGFTLIELMVTLVILAILAAIAVPAYLDYVRRGKLAEGTGNLSNLYLDMQQYYQDNRSFLAGTNCGVTAAATKNFTYSCTATATPSTFTWTAQSNSNLGTAGDYKYTINQDGVRQTPAYKGTVYNPARPCWLFKGNEC